MRIPIAQIPLRPVLRRRRGTAALIVHGGHVADDDDIDKASSTGARRWTGYWKPKVPVTWKTRGGSHAMARRFDIARLWDVISDTRNRVCLDTCHTWAAGEPKPCRRSDQAYRPRIDLVHCATPGTKRDQAVTATPTSAAAD